MFMKLDSFIISSPVRHWHKNVILGKVEHCSARLQHRWQIEITSTGEWQVQQPRILKKISPPNTQRIPIHRRLQSLLTSLLCNWIARQGQTKEKSCCSLNNVLHLQEIPLLWKLLKLCFSTQIAQAICNQWIWWSKVKWNEAKWSAQYREGRGEES